MQHSTAQARRRPGPQAAAVAAPAPIPAPSAAPSAAATTTQRARAAALAVAAQLSALPACFVVLPAAAAASAAAPAPAPANGGSGRTLDVGTPAVRAALKALVSSTQFGASSSAAAGGSGDADDMGGAAEADAGEERAGKAGKKPMRLTASGRHAMSEARGLHAGAMGGSAPLVSYASAEGIAPAVAASVAAGAGAATVAAPSSRPSTVGAALARSSLLSSVSLAGGGNGAAAAALDGRRAGKAEAAPATAGRNWFDMPAADLTPEQKQELTIIRSRSYLDPKRHYKTARDEARGPLPKFVQLGTVQEGAGEFYSARMTRAERKGTLVEQLLADEQFRRYAKRNYEAVAAKAAAGGKLAFKRRKLAAMPAWKRGAQGAGNKRR